jgi:Mannosyl-glycoprotein endo-beta-N-acetylglucosaminidase
MNQYRQIIINTSIEEGVDKVNPALPSLMVAQSGHETADWTSNVFKTCNNGFGYKYVGQKLAEGACTGAPEGDSYAKYKDLADSTREMARWIIRRKEKFVAVDTLEEYAKVLHDEGYYGDQNGKGYSIYLAGLKRYYVQIKEGVTTAIYSHPEISIATGITIFTMLGYYIYRVAKSKK